MSAVTVNDQVGLGYPNNRRELEQTDPKQTTELKITRFGNTAANLTSV